MGARLLRGPLQARVQFALTIMFHYLFPPLTIATVFPVTGSSPP